MPSTVGIVASGEDVLNDAVFWVDAGRSSVVSGALSNLGTGGSALNAVFGNSTGTDSFDPALLTHTGTNYLHLPGVTNSANFASAPNSGASLSGDVSIAVRYDASNKNDDRALLLKRQSGVDSNLYPFLFGQWPNAGGSLKFAWSDTAGVVHTLYGTLAVPATAKWVGVQHDIDNGSSGNTAHFYWSADVTNPTWTLLQSVTEAFVDAAGRRVNAAQIGVGGTDVGNYGAIGNYYEAKVWSGLTFTNAPLFHADFTTGITSGAQTTFTESSANAATVTINRSTSGRKAVAVTRPILLFGTDDYLEVPDNDLLDFGASEPFTVVAVVRQWATPTSSGRVISKTDIAGAGWQMLNNSTLANRYFTISDGTTLVNAGVGNPYTIGSLAITTAVRDIVADKVTLYNGTSAQVGTTDTTTGSLANAVPMRIGQRAGGAYSDMELLAAVVWRRALNANEIATIVARYT